MLTGQYFNYAKKVWSGSANGKVDGWFIPRKKLNYGELLESNVQKQAFEADVNSNVKAQYEGLKATLAKYRELEKQGPDIQFAALEKTSVIKPGDSSAIIAAVRKKMNQLGLLNEDNQSHFFDPSLAGAIILFKKTNGLKPDTVINNEMIKTLNIPLKKRIEQILVNMERMRWIPSTINTDEFILVNIPAFTLSYYEGGKNVWGCNVVVGKPMHKTVIFTGKMEYVVFSPYWNVPPSIIRNEIKPGMNRNPKYLQAHNMEWNGGHVRQRPGPRNALGLVKFIFPNSNNIYLHDTPSKNLFNEDSRAFSHGCIRVAKPRDLAIRILKQAPEWTEAKIDAAMHAGSERYVTLKKQIPVYIGYFTAFMDIDGHVNFRPDIYHRDASLLSLIMQ
jgi:murein L,D-transpeptidase YcbB/YkuD